MEQDPGFACSSDYHTILSKVNESMQLDQNLIRMKDKQFGTSIGVIQILPEKWLLMHVTKDVRLKF